MAAVREAKGTPLELKLFSRTKSAPYKAGPDLEDGTQLVSPDGNGHGTTTATTRPDTSRSTAELRGPEGADGDSVLRQRAPGTSREDTTTTAQTPTTSTAVEPEKKQDRTFFKHLTPKEPFTVRNQIQRTLFGSWVNVLLLCAPVGIAVNYVHSVSRVAVFVINFIAIVPLAGMLGFATEEIALRTGETLGGLLNATFG